MMTKTMVALLALAWAGVVGCDKPEGSAPAGSASAVVTAASASATASARATTPASADATEPAPAAEASGSAAVPSKKYDCGAKGQKPCPMQGWMKKVMAPASSSGEGDKLAEALTYVAKRPPPGYADWVAYANEGVAKAKAGDIDGAKASCRKCHDAYKEDYRAKMRDRPW
jgi:hypothetical protein